MLDTFCFKRLACVWFRPFTGYAVSQNLLPVPWASYAKDNLASLISSSLPQLSYTPTFTFQSLASHVCYTELVLKNSMMNLSLLLAFSSQLVCFWWCFSTSRGSKNVQTELNVGEKPQTECFIFKMKERKAVTQSWLIHNITREKKNAPLLGRCSAVSRQDSLRSISSSQWFPSECFQFSFFFFCRNLDKEWILKEAKKV